MDLAQGYMAVKPVVVAEGNHEACGSCLQNVPEIPYSAGNFTQYKSRFHSVSLNSNTGNNRYYSLNRGLAHFLVFTAESFVYSVSDAFNDNMVFFYTPTQMLAGEAPAGRSLRIGGMVEAGSIEREAGTLTIRFRITDQDKTIPVTYTGVLPDLFKEGKGAVAQGELKDGVFVASEILAKHDENYMPPKLKN